FARSLQKLSSVPVGYETRHLLMFRISPAEAGYNLAAGLPLFEELTTKFASIPGVRSVAVSSNGLFYGSDSGGEGSVPGETFPEKTDMGARFDNVGPGYFATVGVPILTGRDVDASDASGMRSCWLGEVMRKKFFPQKSPLGQQMIIHYSFGDFPCEIRGVV